MKGPILNESEKYVTEEMKKKIEAEKRWLLGVGVWGCGATMSEYRRVASNG